MADSRTRTPHISATKLNRVANAAPSAAKSALTAICFHLTTLSITTALPASRAPGQLALGDPMPPNGRGARINSVRSKGGTHKDPIPLQTPDALM